MSDKMFILLSNILLDKSYILLPHSVLYAHGAHVLVHVFRQTLKNINPNANANATKAIEI